MPSSITSDRDYLELVDHDDITLSASSNQPDSDGQLPQTILSDHPFDVGSGVTVTHNIGSIPIVRLFYDPDKNGKLYSTPRFTTGDYLAQASGPRVFPVSTSTATKILMNAPSSVTNIPVHYRIYKFGTKGFTSDTEIDKIFNKGTADASTSAAADSLSPVLATDTIPHGQGEQILWKLQFSDDQVNWYDEGNLLFGGADTSSGPPGGPYARYYYKTAYGYADSTNFYVNYVHNHPSGQTLYVRFVWEYKD